MAYYREAIVYAVCYCGTAIGLLHPWRTIILMYVLYGRVVTAWVIRFILCAVAWYVRGYSVVSNDLGRGYSRDTAYLLRPDSVVTPSLLRPNCVLALSSFVWNERAGPGIRRQAGTAGK